MIEVKVDHHEKGDGTIVYHVYVSRNGNSWTGIPVDFKTRVAAQSVAFVIDSAALAEADSCDSCEGGGRILNPEDDAPDRGFVDCPDCEGSGVAR